MAVVVVISVWRCRSRWNLAGRPSRHRWIQVGGEGGVRLEVGSGGEVGVGLARGAAEARARVFPMKGHGQALPEPDGAGGFSLELAGSQSRRFGKLRPNTPSHLTPAAPDRLHDHRDEG